MAVCPLKPRPGASVTSVRNFRKCPHQTLHVKDSLFFLTVGQSLKRTLESSQNVEQLKSNGILKAVLSYFFSLVCCPSFSEEPCLPLFFFFFLLFGAVGRRLFALQSLSRLKAAPNRATILFETVKPNSKTSQSPSRNSCPSELGAAAMFAWGVHFLASSTFPPYIFLSVEQCAIACVSSSTDRPLKCCSCDTNHHQAKEEDYTKRRHFQKH